MLWFWIFVVPAVVLAIFALRGERTRAEYVTSRMAALDEPPEQPWPPVSLVVTVIGKAADLGETLRLLAEQDYPDFELIVATPDADSLPPGSLPPAVKMVLGGAGDRIALLQAGTRAARQRSTVFAFAAPYGIMSSFWLRALVAPLSEPGVRASTGFRCYTPEPPAFWSLMRSVWNGIIAGRFGPSGVDFAWGGAIAMSREEFAQAQMEARWRGDIALTRASLHAQGSIAFAPGAVVTCASRVTARQFLRQARREMAAARMDVPRLWWTALLTHVIYCGAMLVSAIAIARGSRGAEWALVVLFGLGMLKGANRATLAKAQLPQFKTWFDHYSWTHTFWVPAATWIWLYVLASSAVLQPHCDTITD